MEISARKKEWPADRASAVINYPMPANLEDLTKELGEEVVYNNAVDSIVISVQAAMRRILANDKLSDEQKQAELTKLESYKPSTGNVTRRSTTEKIEDLTTKMTAEERAALIEKLQAQLKQAA